MSDPAGSLRATLDRLHRQLAEADDLDASQREALQATVRDIEAHLETRGTAPRDEEDSLGEHLGRLTREFETSHPRLAETVNRVVDALAALGI